MEHSFGFQGTHQPFWLFVCAVALIGAGFLIVTLFRYERRLVPHRTGMILLTLRIGVLLLLLFAFLQPVMSWTIERRQRGRIVIGVDISESMKTQDEHASLAEKLRWARALGMIGNRDLDASLDRWIEAAERGEEPEWVTAEEEPDPEKRLQRARSRQENIEELSESLNELSRMELASKLLRKTARPLIDELSEVAEVELQLFAGEAEDITPELLEAALENPPQSVQPQASNVSSALRHAASDLESSQLLGIVLLTDGRDNSQDDPLNQSIRLGLTGIPVYPVLIGSERRPKDLSVASLDFPQTAFKDDKVVLKAAINTSGYENQKIDIELRSAGNEPVLRSFTADGTTSIAEFDLDATQLGRREYSLFIPEQPGETRGDNNEKSFAMTVVDDTVNVFLLEGEARWEFRFIDNAFSRDERVEVDKVVFDQPYLDILEETFFPRELKLPADADDLADSPFAESDLVILGDVPPGELGPAAIHLLDRFVADAGGTLVLVAGKNYMPLAFENPELEALLPVTQLRPVNVNDRFARGAPHERGFHLALTPEGQGEAFLQFSPDPVENNLIWNRMPGFTWGLLGEAKRGSSVLAYAAGGDNIPSLIDQRQSAAIVHQYYGFGQVLWIGVDSTWRWRYRAGDKYHHRFWGQLGRWAARNKSSAGNQFVRFGPTQIDIGQGDDATISARWTQPYLREFPNLKAKAELYRLDSNDRRELFTSIDLVANPRRPLFHEGRAVSLPAGRYRVKLVVEGADERSSGLEAPLYVQERTTLELSDLSANRDLLAQMANLSNGRMYYPDQVQDLIKHLRDPLEQRTMREEVELWDHWLLMLAFFGLLTTEWVLRKLNGLP
ncbi:MAG TPA: hypothetical protein VMM56_00665 [Planctomycetaceae bacterium]|nr:hypothetical protein [Planctomycetaceae bacterium]